VLGLTALPVGIVLALGALYLRSQGMPGGTLFSTALTGMGAVAIGLNLGTGIRLGRLHIRRVAPALVMAAIAIAIGVLGFPLLYVLAVMLPVSLALAWLEQQE
jgi:chromate transporter